MSEDKVNTTFNANDSFEKIAPDGDPFATNATQNNAENDVAESNAVEDGVDFDESELAQFANEVSEDNDSREASKGITATEETSNEEDLESDLAAFAGVTETPTAPDNIFVDDIAGFAKGFPDWDLLPPLQRKKK